MVPERGQWFSGWRPYWPLSGTLSFLFCTPGFRGQQPLHPGLSIFSPSGAENRQTAFTGRLQLLIAMYAGPFKGPSSSYQLCWWLLTPLFADPLPVPGTAADGAAFRNRSQHLHESAFAEDMTGLRPFDDEYLTHDALLLAFPVSFLQPHNNYTISSPGNYNKNLTFALPNIHDIYSIRFFI
jgi:hypothetical protein